MRLSEALVFANCKTLGPEDRVGGGSRLRRLTVVFAADGTIVRGLKPFFFEGATSSTLTLDEDAFRFGIGLS